MTHFCPTQVFVVNQFYEDCNDRSTVGAFMDFMDAAKACFEDAKENWEEDNYALKFLHAGFDKAWFEEHYDNEPQGIYYTIEKMELR